MLFSLFYILPLFIISSKISILPFILMALFPALSHTEVHIYTALHITNYSWFIRIYSATHITTDRATCFVTHTYVGLDVVCATKYQVTGTHIILFYVPGPHNNQYRLLQMLFRSNNLTLNRVSTMGMGMSRDACSADLKQLFSL